MTDDWKIDSHTVELRYRWDLGSFDLQPHVRYYMQSAADFYHGALFAGDPDAPVRVGGLPRR